LLRERGGLETTRDASKEENDSDLAIIFDIILILYADLADVSLENLFVC